MTTAENHVGVAMGYLGFIGESLSRGTVITLYDIQSPTRTIYSFAHPTERLFDARIITVRDWIFTEILHEKVPRTYILKAAQ